MGHNTLMCGTCAIHLRLQLVHSKDVKKLFCLCSQGQLQWHHITSEAFQEGWFQQKREADRGIDFDLGSILSVDWVDLKMLTMISALAACLGTLEACMAVPSHTLLFFSSSRVWKVALTGKCVFLLQICCTEIR